MHCNADRSSRLHRFESDVFLNCSEGLRRIVLPCPKQAVSKSRVQRATPNHGLTWIDAGRLDLNQNLACSWYGEGPVAHVDAAV